MSLYKGTTLISGHQVLYAVKGQNTDGAMTQKAATDSFADVNLSNLSSSSSKNFDGQWVFPSSLTLLASGVTYPTSTNTQYDVSSFLPNDSYNYEVLICGAVATGTTSGNPCQLNLQTDLLTNSNYVTICGNRTRTNANTYASGVAILPIGTGRKLIVVAQSNLVGTYNMWVSGYRRIGTNS